MALIPPVGSPPRWVRRARLPLLVLACLFAVAALTLASPAAEGQVELTASSYAISDGDGDGYDDRVQVNATVHNTDQAQFQRYTLEVALEHEGVRIDLSTRDGQLDANASTDLTVMVGTDAGSPAGTYAVLVLLHAGELTSEVVDSDGTTADLLPVGEYQLSIQVNRTSAVALENTSVGFLLTVGSLSNNPTGANLSVVPTLGWTYRLEAEGVDLEPGGEVQLELTVEVPPNATANGQETLDIVVSATRNATAFANLRVTVTVAKQTFLVDLVLVTTQVQVAAGDTVTAEGRVHNGGNNLDNVTLMADVPPGWTAVFEPPHLLLARDAWQGFLLHLTPPASLVESGTSQMNVSALSSGLVSESVAALKVIYNSAELSMEGAEITVTPVLPKAGDEVTLQVSLRNTGSVTAENVLVLVLSDGEELARDIVDDIPPRGTGIATLRWTADPGTRLLRVVADPDDDIPESIEDNNVATWTLEVTSPDLVVTRTNLTITPGYPTEGEEAIIAITVWNGAAQTAPPFEVTVLVGGEVLRTLSVDTGLTGGGNVTLETNWTATRGRHTFTVRVDPTNQVDEEDRTNNEASRSFSVNSRPVADLEILLAQVDEGETVTMDASGSEDPDGRVRQYYFDYGDGTDSGWVFVSVINHTYGQTGVYEARAYVRDEGGAQSAEPAVVEVTVRRIDDDGGDDTPAPGASAVLAALLAVALLATLSRRSRSQGGGG